MRQIFKNRRLASKIIVLISLTTTITAFTMGAFAYLRVASITVETAKQGLAGEARLLAEQFLDSFHDMENDILILRYTPPIEGIVRARQNDGIDPLDGSSEQAWKTRLERIFFSMMANRPEYTKIRYIAAWGEGRELVRVNRSTAGLKRVSAADLRVTGHEDYVLAGMQLDDGDLHLSPVTIDLDGSTIDKRPVSTIRIVAPVYHLGRQVGLIIIDADYEHLLAKTFRKLAPTRDMEVRNRTGDLMTYESDSGSVEFQAKSGQGAMPPPIPEPVAHTSSHERTVVTSSTIAHYVRHMLTTDPSGEYVDVIVRAPRETLLAPARATQKDTLLLALCAVLTCVAISFVTARQFTRPIAKLAAAIGKARSYDDVAHLPVEANDEIGELARGFQRLGERLQRSETRAEAVLQNVVDGIITIGSDGTIESLNPACEAILGYSRQEMLGHNIAMIIPKEMTKKFRGIVDSYQQEDGRPIGDKKQELKVIHKDGREIIIAVSVSESRIGDRHLYTGVIRDVTQEKETQKMKDAFVSTVSHELRTPLTSILGALGILRHITEGKLDARSQRMLLMSHENCQRLANLVNDILDVEKMSSGEMTYQIAPTEMVSLSRDTVERHSTYAHQNELHFQFVESAKDVYCEVDPIRYTQVLENLLSNAAKFSPKGGTVRFDIGTNGSGWFRISVSDDGPGVPDQFKSRIFQRFAQADDSYTRAKDGTGLGLNIAKTIVEAFGGHLSFDSKKGEGSTFHVDLPQCEYKEVA